MSGETREAEETRANKQKSACFDEAAFAGLVKELVGPPVAKLFADGDVIL